MDPRLGQIALDIATKAHASQKRWGGEPYITHPIAVAERFAEDDIRRAIGYLHDVLEDSGMTPGGLKTALLYRAQELKIQNAAYLIGDIVDAVVRLTHRPYENYLEYIVQVAQNLLAIDVKCEDIMHNLHDLKQDPKKNKHRIDRYLLALFILMERKNDVVHGPVSDEQLLQACTP